MKNNCKCTTDQTTGNTEFTPGILSCNICGGFLSFKSIDMEDILKKYEAEIEIKKLVKKLTARYSNVCIAMRESKHDEDNIEIELNLLVNLLRHYKDAYNFPNLGI